MAVRMAGSVADLIKGVLEAAAIADVAKGRQVRYGKLTYGSIPELYGHAVTSLKEEGSPLSITAIRQRARDLIEMQEAMIEDDIGINYDARGRALDPEWN